jgi:hypothetical protein
MKLITGTIIFLSILVYSCGKEGKGEKIIQNTSIKAIKVKVLKKLYSNKVGDSILVSSKSQATLEKAVSSSGPIYSNVDGCVRPETDSIVIEVVDNPQLKVSKNLNSSDNWIFYRDANFKGISEECRIQITDADIVPK